MTATQVLYLIIALFVVEAAMFVFALRWAKRRMQERTQALVDDMGQSGEKLVLGPESALYRGGTGDFSRVKGSGVIALTPKRLVFRKLVGGEVEVPLNEIASVSENKWFLAAYHNGRQHLILELTDGTKVGFMVKDHQRWMEAVREAIAARS